MKYFYEIDDTNCKKIEESQNFSLNLVLVWQSIPAPTPHYTIIRNHKPMTLQRVVNLEPQISSPYFEI